MPKSGMGSTFRRRLEDGPAAASSILPQPKAELGAECEECRGVFDPDQLFDGLCERCYLGAEGPMDDWSFARDFRL
jgi:hypothetical protein